jgi:hypothetical protein
MKTYLDNLRPFERRVVVVVGLMLFVVANFWFVIPRFGDWNQMRIRRWDAEERLVRFQNEVAQMPTIKRKVDEMEKRTQPVPREEQFSQFSHTYLNQAAKSGVFIDNTSRPIVRTNDQFFIEQAQVITVHSGEAQLVDFLFNLGAGESLIRVRELNLRPDAPRQQLSAQIKLVANYQKKAPVKSTLPAQKNAAAAAPTKTSIATAKRQ